jgi:hypothetical protein
MHIICAIQSWCSFCIQWLHTRDGCSFCWYWRNCWPSLFKLSFHNNIAEQMFYCIKCICIDTVETTMFLFLINAVQVPTQNSCMSRTSLVFVFFFAICTNLKRRSYIYITPSYNSGRRGRDRMVVGFITTYICNKCQSPLTLWVWIPLRRGVLDTTLCDKVCQSLVFSPPIKLTATITGILLKVTLNTITLTL